ncbi:MAG TPA: hypothetical protein VHR97_09425 [Candidatus Baltobacteraceae bacterium]|nr:hypothetical protein [Candidatus Baltobacteraceae bacterium]
MSVSLRAFGLGVVIVTELVSGARAADTALGSWLPKADSGFNAWSRGQATQVTRYDYFVCGTSAEPTLPKHDLHYPGSACPLLKSATPFVYGAAEPIKGSILFDRSEGVVFFNTGCCAWRGYVLVAGTGAPPQQVARANLKDVRTARGIKLGMTPPEVIAVYGHALLRSGASRPGMGALYYTTMRGTPQKSPDACGQHQSFFFKQGRLVEIDLLMGC